MIERDDDGKFKPIEESIATAICGLYEEGVSTVKLAKQFNVSRAYVSKLLDKRGVSKRTLSQAIRQYNFNEHYFDAIDTEPVAYWLGFTAADGCVYENRTLYGLSRVDKCHLELLLKYVSGDYPIRDSLNNHGDEVSSLDMSSETTVVALKRHGIMEAKSLIIRWPTTVPYDLMPHYARGYFDGDGSVYLVKSTSGSPQLKFEVTSNYGYVRSYQKFLMERLGLNQVKIVQKSENGFSLVYSGNQQVVRIYDFLYRDATVWLGRKRDIVNEFLRNGVRQ